MMSERSTFQQELLHILHAYDLGSIRSYRRTDSGFVNENWVMETERGTYFLKHRHPRLCCPPTIRAQHELIDWLHRAGFPCPLLVPTVRGGTLLVEGRKCYEVQEYIEGVHYDHHRRAHLDEAAYVLGDYHEMIQGFTRPELREAVASYSPTNVAQRLDSVLTAWREEKAVVPEEMIQRLHEHIRELETSFSTHGHMLHVVVHGDYYADNLLFVGDRIVAVVDYDRASWQPRVAELAEALIYFCSPRKRQLHHLAYPGVLEWEPFGRFLQSYGSSSLPSEEEVLALPDYVRCIWLQMALQHPLEGPLPPGNVSALEETLLLSDWAGDQAATMVELARSSLGF